MEVEGRWINLFLVNREAILKAVDTPHRTIHSFPWRWKYLFDELNLIKIERNLIIHVMILFLVLSAEK